MAEVGRKIEKGLEIGPRKRLTIDQALWQTYALGGGLGKLQYRCDLIIHSVWISISWSLLTLLVTNLGS